MPFKKIWRIIATMIPFVALSYNVSAYDVVEVTDGGTITGIISATGSIPANLNIAISKNTDYCGSSLITDYLQVDAQGGLENAVVMLQNVPAGKAFDKKQVHSLDNVDCMFKPHVSVAIKGQFIGINNADPILHNTHLYQGRNNRTLYNIALPLQNKVIKKLLRRTGKVTVKCDAHEWMLAYVYVSDNPYIAVTAADGSFSISDVPPGSYTLHIWHEVLGEISTEITIEAGQETAVQHSFSGAG